MGTTYDTGALIGADRSDRRLGLLHQDALDRGEMPTVPVAVLAQAWRGGPQAALSRLLRGCEIEEMTESIARRAGTLCARAGTTDIVDATVAAGAASRGDRIITSDPDDLRALADVMARPPTIVPI